MKRPFRSESTHSVDSMGDGLANPSIDGMNEALRLMPHTGRGTTLQPQVTRWRINGYPALILIWTADQWERLEDRPSDAQYYPCGVWCALRML